MDKEIKPRYKPPYGSSYPSSSGAAKGLKQKLKYWAGKDDKVEYNILVAQAFNEVEHKDDLPDEAIINKAKKNFEIILALRNDKDIQRMFSEYKQNLIADKAEKSDEENISAEDLPF